jgi:hypothetical protein
MGTEWVIVIGAAVTGTLTLLGTAVPKIIDAIRERGDRDRKKDAARAAAISKLRRAYSMGHPHLTDIQDATWVHVSSAAADCIPYTDPDSEGRELLLKLIRHEKVDVDALIAALPE